MSTVFLVIAIALLIGAVLQPASVQDYSDRLARYCRR